jgi:AcrR family transcriptional regulator
MPDMPRTDLGPAASTGKPSGRQRRKAARPAELLEAAMDLFVEKGFSAARSEEVAARAGVSKGTLYLYFPSKDDLFKSVIRTYLTAPIAEGQALADSFQGTCADLLGRLLRMLWQQLGHTPAGGVCKVVMAEARNFPDIATFYVREVIEPTHRLMSGVLRRGVARGEFRELDTEHAVPALIAPALLLAMHAHSVGACPACQELPQDADRTMETHIHLILDGLLQRPSQASGPRQRPA